MKTKPGHQLHNWSTSVPIWKDDTLFGSAISQDRPFGDHNCRRKAVFRDSEIQPGPKFIAASFGSRGSSMLAWGKDHLRPPRILYKEHYRPYLKRENPSDPREMGSPVLGRWPDNPPGEIPSEQPSRRMHLSRTDSRLKACHCPYPEQGPLCMAPSVVTTITGGVDDSDDPTSTLAIRVAKWANGREKQAKMGVQDCYTFYINTSTVNPGSKTSPSQLELQGTAIVCSTTTSTAVTTRDSSTETTEDERVPGATGKPPGQKNDQPPPSDKGPVAIPALGCSSEHGASNRVERLEARRDCLARRRRFVEKAIHDLLWQSQPSSAPYDMGTREGVKKRIAQLELELAEIKKEEHYVGLSLLRAFRSRDVEDYCSEGSSSLWASRLTR
ncbi:hypothetical protein BJX61DRAFT_539172 [Aspergillus egyptiacus]|nr:hypothetical protein BJX61DRAFT_539172 [Aspergillus egyptiacus]